MNDDQIEIVYYKDYRTDTVDLELSRITPFGTFEIKSQKPFVQLESLSKLLTDLSSLESDADETEPLITMDVAHIYEEKIEFTWKTVNVTATTIRFELNFERPLEVSQMIESPHILEIRIHDAQMFASRVGSVIEARGILFEGNIPRQIVFADSELSKIVVIATEVIATSIKITIVTAFALSFFWKLGMKLLIGNLWVAQVAILALGGIGTVVPANITLFIG